nr:reverse transcriptase zinc-binding domain-containing protein [Tanacetum cinerariifolium]
MEINGYNVFKLVKKMKFLKKPFAKVVTLTSTGSGYGYTLASFKKSWDGVGDDVCKAVRDFVMNGKLLQEINHTILAVLPKMILEATSSSRGSYVPVFVYVIVMEILTLILKRKVREDGELTYHYKCGKQKIVNICFVDDLIMFARGDVHSARVLIEALDEFKGVVKESILQLMPFEHGTLPVKYLEEPFAGNMKRGKAKVAWEDVCIPKNEGGLGVRKIETVNIALMTSHNWKIITNKESMWVRWIHAYKLNNQSFWDVRLLSNVSWGWRKILQIRNIVRPHIWYKIDTLHWKLHDGTLSSFSVRHAWHSIRVRGTEVDWFKIVWSSYSIPRHVIHMWLVMRKRLLTQDRIRQRDVLNMDNINFASSKWSDVVDWLLPIAKRNNAISIFGRLIVAATSYFVWQERNNRVHGNGERQPEQLSKIVVDMVPFKLASIRFKKKVRVEQMRRTWKISSIISGGG